MGEILDNIFPTIANHKANKVLCKKMHPLNDGGENTGPTGVQCYIDNADELSIETLKERYVDTFKTKDKLEDKAKTNVIGITISITLIMGASGTLSTLNRRFPSLVLSWITFALVVVTVVYMIIAGLLAIRMLIGENEIYIVELNSLASGGTALRDDYAKCIFMNQIKNTIRNNYIFTSYKCIKNSLIVLFVVFILMVIPVNALNANNDKESKYSPQSYFFLFSSSAANYIKENEIRDTAEKAMISTINTPGRNEKVHAFGIADKRII